MSVEDAHIALVVRLKHLVSPEIFQVADLLSEDEDVSSILSQNPSDKLFEAAEV